eukprot:TRINITY_DN7701_c0_g1_i11.p1 TRINITY_DN7701_c0_g1~~TRINITY_DN7701_c0_g1_i11.p1  ORF type:complete len:153 (+),score=23.95 TRINITY_DN7701_c0_g1_i11:146-604(+)
MSLFNGTYPVLLNIYDLSPLNRYLRFFTLGLYHSAIEIDGTEISFGGGEQPIGGSGISIGEPLYKHGFVLVETRFVGVIKSRSQADAVIRELEGTFQASQYNTVGKNCNHFTEEFCYRLVKKHIPSYVNRMARLGNMFGCGQGGYSSLAQSN